MYNPRRNDGGSFLGTWFKHVASAPLPTAQSVLRTAVLAALCTKRHVPDAPRSLLEEHRPGSSISPDRRWSARFHPYSVRRDMSLKNVMRIEAITLCND